MNDLMKNKDEEQRKNQECWVGDWTARRRMLGTQKNARKKK